MMVKEKKWIAIFNINARECYIERRDAKLKHFIINNDIKSFLVSIRTKFLFDQYKYKFNNEN